MNAADATVWALTDDRPGNNAQVLGVAEALGRPFRDVPLAYTRAARLPDWLRGASLLGLTPATVATLVPPYPALVITAGRRAAPAGRWLRAQAGTRHVQLMDPGPEARRAVDLLVLPEHDRPVRTNAPVLRVTGAPHRWTPERLAGAAAEWRPAFDGLPGPWIAALVGGSTKRRRFTPAMAETLGARLAALADSTGGSLLVSTSRRTPADAEERLRRATAGRPGVFYAWHAGGTNPYPGFLALADAIVVTGESMGMCTEACAAPGAVHIFAPEGLVTAKNARLHRALYDGGYATPLPDHWAPVGHPPLNPAAEVAAAIRQRWPDG